MTDLTADHQQGAPHLSATREHALEFYNLSMVFPDGTHALDNVSINIDPGEFVTVVGPSGCGKSTLLRIASGLETHTGGECNTHAHSAATNHGGSGGVRDANATA